MPGGGREDDGMGMGKSCKDITLPKTRNTILVLVTENLRSTEERTTARPKTHKKLKGDVRESAGEDEESEKEKYVLVPESRPGEKS